MGPTSLTGNDDYIHNNLKYIGIGGRAGVMLMKNYNPS